MKYIKVIICLLISSLFLISCNGNDSNELKFALYEKASLGIGESAEIVEDKFPFLTYRDSDCYTWNGNSLKINLNKVYEKLDGKFLYQEFVLKINNKKVINGAFLSPLSSYYPTSNELKVFLIDDSKHDQLIEIYNSKN